MNLVKLCILEFCYIKLHDKSHDVTDFVLCQNIFGIIVSNFWLMVKNSDLITLLNTTTSVQPFLFS